MKIVGWRLLAAALALLVLPPSLTACPGIVTPTATGAPTPPGVTSVAPTDTPASEATPPTPTSPPPAPTPSPEMATYHRGDWGVSFDIPSEWDIMEESAAHVLFARQADLTMLYVRFESEEIDLTSELLQSLLQIFAGPEDETEIGEPYWRSVGGYDAATTQITATIGGVEMSGPIALVKHPHADGSLVCLAWSISALFEQKQPTFDAIFESARLFPPNAEAVGQFPPVQDIAGPQIDVLSVNHFVDLGGALHFVGELRNNAEMPIEDVAVLVRLFGADGQMITDEQWRIPVNFVPVGGMAPFEVLFLDPPGQWDAWEIEVKGEPADFMLSYTYTDLEIVEHESEAPDFGEYRITGLVRNSGEGNARFVQITAILYDADENVVAVDYTYVDSALLGAGETSPFQLTVLSTAGPAESYRLLVQGAEAH